MYFLELEKVYISWIRNVYFLELENVIFFKKTSVHT